MRAAGASISTIALALRRSRSTISRELRRNCLPQGGYNARHADGAYIQRRQRDAILQLDEKLQDFVIQRLADGWSPEQISGWLAAGHEHLRRVCPETIYRFIYRASQKTRQLWRYLTRRRKHRRPLKTRPSRDTIKDRNSIHDRPRAIY